MTFASPLVALAALGFVLGLIWAIQRVVRTGFLARALPSQTAGGRLRVHQVLVLDARRRLHLVHCDGRDVLLLTGGSSDVVVGWLDREGAA
jgi:flagellar protein FliO/FliZ